ncbi:MarC family protein [Sediminispirochaeta bajacaliforniensis]|uniref:MarC family protein n=1 Tax=Sediminispirochaeta bajacaliforniensis TaxID=148 RepID=UPI0003729530|nr:MarC family protein [Sediminispirochaeta bajacaliforniensis]
MELFNGNDFFNSFLILLALINPISKVFVIATLSKEYPHGEVNRVVFRSSVIAMAILLIFGLTGNFILNKLFHVELYSFKLAGGFVLAVRGYTALNKGLFFELSHGQKLHDASVVPIASPMIAGPATITASVSLQTMYGIGSVLTAIVTVIAVNMIVMLFSEQIGNVLNRYNLMGALIRITGLIVCTMGVQMMVNGVLDIRLLM